MLIKLLALVVTVFVFVGCECSGSKPTADSQSQNSSDPGTPEEQAGSIGAFTVTMPQNGVVGPNVRAEWSTATHSEGTLYDYMIGKNADCSDIAYQGSDLPLNKIALILGKGTYYLCVTAKKDGESREADNTPYKFDVVLES